MDQQSIQMFVLQNGKKFDEFQLQRAQRDFKMCRTTSLQ